MQTSIKEYIGARYVPLFYDDGHGGAEWNINDTYEALTIVQYQGNSFTSRQYVPAGININNTAYWLETGNWNSQVEQYRREVFGFSDRIDAAQAAGDQGIAKAATALARANTGVTNAAAAQTTADGAVSVNNTQNSRLTALEARPIVQNRINQRYFIFIGDSYQVGTTKGGTTKSFLDYIIDWNVIPAGHLFHAENGGAGFTKANNTFLQLLQGLNSQITNKSQITDIVVTGCYNDYGAPGNIISAIKTFNNYVVSNYPNAKITLIPAGWRKYTGNAGGSFGDIFKAVEYWYYGAAEVGASYAPGAHSLLARMPVYISNDGIHPTIEGYQALAYVVINALTGGDDTFQLDEFMAFTCQPALTGQTLSGNWYILPRGNDVQYVTSTNVTANYNPIANANRPFINTKGGFIPISAAGPWPYMFSGGHYPAGSQPIVMNGWKDDETPQITINTVGTWGVDENGVLGLHICYAFDDGQFHSFRVNAVYMDTVSFTANT